MKLIELVYEGGPVLDMALHAQRGVLDAELGDGFVSADMRGVPAGNRKAFLQATSRKGQPANLLVRGLSGVREACAYFPKSAIFMDALGKSDAPEPAEFFMQSQRTRRVFVYGDEMSRAVRKAGIGEIARLSGPYLPPLRMPSQKSSAPFVVGVPSLGDGVLLAVAKLKAAQEKVPFAIVAQVSVRGVETVPTCVDVAEMCDLLVVPDEQMDRGGPSEGAMLALAVGRALCTTGSSALYNMAYSSGKFLLAERYVPASYAACALLYSQQRTSLDAFPATVTQEWDTVPREILRRLA